MLALSSAIPTRYHRLPAGPKLGALVVSTCLLFLTDSLPVLCAVLIAVLAAHAAEGRAFLRQGLRMLRPLWLFVAVVAAWHLVTGDARAGAVVIARLVTVVAFANLVTTTTRLDDMLEFLTRLASPLRRLGVRPEALGLSVALVIRFTPVLIERGRQLVEAWRARSPRRPGWPVVVPITLLAIDDAERVAEALRARGGLGN